jgi:TetR/AcrR family transcriptional regulator of autoinduction and epiphytic fitness
MTRVALMDAVDNVMRQDGYAALSARSIGASAGLNYQLVFYYFEKVDNLLLATYRRRTSRLLDNIERALHSDRPLHALWDTSRDPAEAALSFEYMAMSNHSAVIRDETIAHVERTLDTVLQTMAQRASFQLPEGDAFTPIAVTMIVAMIGETLGYQSALGVIGGGMREASTLVEHLIDQIEP